MSRRNSTASSSSSVVGYADRIYDHPAGNVAEQPPPGHEIPAPIFNDPPAPPDPPAVNVPVVPDPAAPIKLTGWRSDVSGILCVTAFVLPWTISLVLSWVAHKRAPFDEVPPEIRIAAGFSTAEVASLGLFFLWACIKAERDRDRPSTATNSEGCGFMLWINFLLWAPMGTGIYIWSLTTKYSHCESGSRSARCRIGKGIVTAIGVYRTLGVLFTMSVILIVENKLSTRWKAQEARRRAINPA